MNAVLDASGAIQSLGETDTLVAPAGGRIVVTTATIADYLVAEQGASGNYDLVLDTATTPHRIVVRARAATADETERDGRNTLLAQVNNAIDGWPTATNAQKLDAVLLCLRAIRAIARYVLRG